MPTTKKVHEPIDAVVTAQPEQQPQSVVGKAPMSRQTIIVLGIVSAVVLFFVGFGLGYWTGHTSRTANQLRYDSSTRWLFDNQGLKNQHSRGGMQGGGASGQQPSNQE